jgi:hypothetical protein
MKKSFSLELTKFRYDGANPKLKHSIMKMELALQYFPNAYNTHSATTMLNNWLRRNPELWEALKEAGYNPRQCYLTPRQIAIIIHYLGEPGDD